MRPCRVVFIAGIEQNLDWSHCIVDVLHVAFQRQQHGAVEPSLPQSFAVRLIRCVDQRPQVSGPLLKGAGERQVIGKPDVPASIAAAVLPYRMSAGC